MKKIKKAVGRNEVGEARRMYAQRPEYTVDHLVKERYPRFGDALADIDDAVCLVHLYATLPSEKHIDPKHTALSKRLAREWQAYVVKTKALRKVCASRRVWVCARVLSALLNCPHKHVHDVQVEEFSVPAMHA